MAQSRLAALERALPLLCCPRCRGAFSLREKSLVCEQNHTYDIAAKGYVNLAPQKRQPKGYDAASFVSRGAFLQAGFYDHILQAVLSRLPVGPVADAGCGEGWFCAHAATQKSEPVLGLDLSRVAVRRAAGCTREVAWLVADLADMPVKNGSLAAVINLFSPASYQAFQRALKPGGLLLKVVPGPEHLRELRALAGDLPQDGPDTGQVAAHFSAHMRLLDDVPLTRILPLAAEDAQHLIQMTPMLFQRDTAGLSPGALHEITIDARLLVGTQPQKEETP